MNEMIPAKKRSGTEASSIGNRAASLSRANMVRRIRPEYPRFLPLTILQGLY